MLLSLKLKNFRNFTQKELYFSEKENLIVGENGVGKTNILEAISLLSGKNILGLDLENLVHEGETIFYIEGEYKNGKKVAISFDIEGKKKKMFVSGKATSLRKIRESSSPVVVFQPLDMNLLYLAPSLRRNFLEEILSQCFDDFSSDYKKYKSILRNRNSVLKAIGEGTVGKSEIDFWDTSFIEIATKIYFYISELDTYVKNNINQRTRPYFFGKVQDVTFEYITKVEFGSVEKTIHEYLKKNFERDIILGTTHIGPHVDDFDIIVGGKSIKNFVSRGEMKTVILGLKLIETDFIKQTTQKSPIILIDDFLSEIDMKHQEKLMESFSDYQMIISSIGELDFDTIINL